VCAAASVRGRRRRASHGGRSSALPFERALVQYRKLTKDALLSLVPEEGPPYLYDLVAAYPSRAGKGLRSALCFATCAALGGNPRQALNSAVAIELFHNAFLIHDDVQDGSENRRGAPTLYREHGTAIAINVGNATNLLALSLLMQNRDILGPQTSWRVVQETELMMRRTLEGQALELAWIRDNALDLDVKDYLQMCLKKTSWYSFIYPMRVGALIAQNGQLEPERFCRFGWYMGAAFQIQDDILNLVGEYQKYGKEIGGDLWEGKRTLILIHLLRNCSLQERNELERFLATTRAERSTAAIRRIYSLMERHRSIEYVRRASRQLAGAALLEGLAALRGVPDSPEKRFILEMVLYVVNRDW
jgi:geranylgeranyl diphosphate synthase type II